MAKALYQVMAEAFVDEGIDTGFFLTGDGNMYWEAAFAATPGVRAVHVRHEHNAATMATAYARITDTVGVASVTCGPGLTQITTALATAVQARIPLVVFAGESPMHTGGYNQEIDQAPLVTCTGARYIAVHSVKRAQQQVAEAFHHARTQRRPVVLGVPFDLQKQMIEDVPDYGPSGRFVPDAGPRWPHPDRLSQAADRIRAAKRIVVLAGRGAKLAQAQQACASLADLCDGALATTLPTRGLFSGHPRDIGVCGGFSHPATTEAIGKCDLVIAVGAGLNQYTGDSGKLFGADDVIAIDDTPNGYSTGNRTAGTFLAADARIGVEALIQALDGHTWDDWGVASYAQRMRTEPVDTTGFPIPDGTTDPRDVIRVLDGAIPKDWAVVNGSGHSSYFSTHMYDRPADNFLTIREFGAIGNGLGFAGGMAMARPDRPTVLLEGDGGFMMHIQELETVRRQGWKMLLCVLNDGAYGSEIHKLRVDGLSDHGAVYGRNDIASIARGFGMKGEIVRHPDEIPALIEAFGKSDGSLLLDIQISDQVVSPRMATKIKR